MRLLLYVLIAAAWGCGDDLAPVDAAADSAVADTAVDTATDSGATVTPVAPPALPALICPEGWRRISADDIESGLERCEPWPEAETPCARHEVRLPGDDACRPVGSVCPADGWPAGLPEAGVLYVRSGAVEPGDGSRSSPYPDVASALAGVPPETTTIALAVGDYPEQITLDASLTLRGACPEGTVLSGRIVPLTVTAPSVVLEDLSFVATARGRLRLGDSSAEVRKVVFDNVVVSGAGPSTIFEDVVMRGGEGGFDTAVLLSSTGSLTLRRVLIEDLPGDGVSAVSGGSRTLTDVYLRRLAGGGLNLGDEISLERVVVEQTVEAGIVAFGTGTMRDVVVRAVAGAGATSAGVVVAGPWTIDGLQVRRAGDVAFALSAGEVTLRDAILEGSDPADGTLGRGIVVAASGGLVAERLLIADARDLGLLAGRGASVTLTDTTISRVAESAAGGFGRCVHGQLGAQLSLDRVRLTDCTEAALTVYGGSAAQLQDVHIRGVHPTRCLEDGCTGAAGFGLLALDEGAIEGTRLIVEGAALAALVVVANGDLDLHDGTVRSNLIGINVQDPAFNLGRVMDRMTFIDNGVNLDSTTLPLPGDNASVELAGP